jgi:hypothetical protein
MRYWLLSLAIALIVMGVCSSQATFVSGQGKDKKPPPKDGKDKGIGKDKKIDPKELPNAPDFKTPEFVLGQRFDYWVKKLHSDDPSEREISMKNILFFGAEKAYEAVPDIIAEVKGHGKPGTAGYTTNIDLSVRVNGIQTLSTIFRYKQNPDKKLLKDAYDQYKLALKSDHVILRMQTMKALPYLGPVAREAFDDVLKLGKDSVSWEIRWEAIPVLMALASPEVPAGPTHPNAPRAEKHFKNRTKWDTKFADAENSYLVRQAAVQAIAAFWISGNGLPKEVMNGMYDPSLPVRLTALQCIAGISHKMSVPEKKEAEKQVNEYLALEKEKALNMWAHATIMTIQKKVTPGEINPILKKLPDNNETDLRLLALQIIGMLGADAKPLALPDVLSLIKGDPEIGIRVAAIQCCVSMHAIEIKPVLQKIVDDKKSDDVLHDAALLAIETLDLQEKMLREHEKKEKEKKDKKGDDKK